MDFEKRTRIVVTGSAVPLETENLESGVGRWHTIRLATLSFSEYLRLDAAAETAFFMRFRHSGISVSIPAD